ncbi:oxidoreductase [Rhodococcus sp. IEGM 1318]|uniref:oxidoreductase n=1 Tax=Rhodococcus sp. IEGM 1318 TaxID=3082226 RepID=UPI002953BCD9|nr:oxidoreductase [Rhodococcus sp. IEGM 1318]MDV8009084.1 oxidoreductase [Rhodococcus sp. IEGM 1318]
MNSIQRKINTGFARTSTADDVLSGLDLTGTTALVTGGYSGLGFEISRSLASVGVRVVVLARRPEQARGAVADFPGIEVRACDLSDPSSVRSCAREMLESRISPAIIICNAGIMACPEVRVGSDWESQFAINHLGHFVLVNLLAPGLPTNGSRVVSVSSAGHFLSGVRWDDIHFRKGYDRWLAYGQAKTANALFAVQLASAGASRGITAFSVHPGSILTPLQRHFSASEKHDLGWTTPNGDAVPGFKTPAQGAATTVWAATAPILVDHAGAYLQDCNIADVAQTDDMSVGGVKPWATDPDDALRLWALSAEMTGVDAFDRR